MKIKQITQIHSSYGRLGIFERVAIERWRALNPDVRYQFIVDEQIDDYINATWPQHGELYNSMFAICKAGVQRLAAVHRWGGLYADCGTYPIKPIAEFYPLDIWDRDLAMFNLKTRACGTTLVTDCIFAAEQGHPFIAGLIEEIFRRTSDPAYRLKCVVPHPTKHFSFDQRRYVFETASVHAFSEFSKSQGIVAVNGLPDAELSDLETAPETVNTLRHSTECWLPDDNRFVTGGVDKDKAELQLLTVIKDRAGI